MFRHTKNVIGLALIVGLTACTSGQSAQVPPFTSANLSLNVAQLAVGVATFGNGSQGTNILATFRQPNGASATLVNTPTVTGPAAWIVPASGNVSGPSPGVDAGTNRLSGSPQIPNGVTSPTPTPATFAQTGGVFSYGIQPDNVSTSGAPVYTVYSQPFFATFSGRSYRGGPPAYPQVRDGTFPAGFFGYSQGFLTVAIPPVAGAYNLNVNVSTSTGGSQNFTASANLASTAGLGVIGPAAPPVPDGAGGLSIAFTAPPGVTETLVDVQVGIGAPGTPAGSWCGSQTTTPGIVYYTVRVVGSGPQVAVLPANLGPTGASAAGCTFAGRTIVTGDTYGVLLVGVNYPAFAAGPPQNTSQTPTLTGANGQADITLSTRQTFTY